MPYSSADRLIRHVTLRQLQIFEAVVRLQGFTRAAEALHLTQPTVSMQIRKLSDAVGTPLLEKSSDGPRPTRAGRQVYETAREILGRMMLLGETAGNRHGVVSGPLHVGVSTTAKYFMPHLLGTFINRHPAVEPRLMVSNQKRAIERLRNHDVDLLVTGWPPEEMAVEARPFVDDELVVVAPPGHPLCGSQRIDVARLGNERFLVREPGSGTRQAIDHLLVTRGIRLMPYMELGSSEAIKQGVMGGLGISVLSRHSIGLELAAGQLAVLDVEGFPLIRSWQVVHPQGEHLPLAARAFIAFLLQEGTEVLKSRWHGPAAMPK